MKCPDCDADVIDISTFAGAQYLCPTCDEVFIFDGDEVYEPTDEKGGLVQSLRALLGTAGGVTPWK